MDTASREAVGWETFILTYSFAMVLWTGDAPAAALVVTTARLSKPWCRLLQSQRVLQLLYWDVGCKLDGPLRSTGGVARPNHSKDYTSQAYYASLGSTLI